MEMEWNKIYNMKFWEELTVYIPSLQFEYLIQVET
jgi:hypothetical protein